MSQTTNQLKSLVHDWIRAYESRDLALVRSLFTDSPMAFHYGTGVDERIAGLSGMLKQFERDWSQSEKGQLELVDFRCESFEDRFGWLTCEVVPTITIAGKAHKFPVLRCSIVAVKSGDNWRIAHSHASWPYSEQKEGESFPTR